MFQFVLNQQILYPTKYDENFTDAAIIFIMDSKTDTINYHTISRKIRDVLEENSFNLWIIIPKWSFNIPNKYQIKQKIEQSKQNLQQHGQKGSKYFVMGHQDGAYVAQEYLQNNPDNFEGLIMLSASLKRKQRKIEETGQSLINYITPTLTICGEKDGIYQVTRCAESQFHHVYNNKKQLNQHNVTIIEGTNHWAFAGGEPNEQILKNDLSQEISTLETHTIVALEILNFICDVRFITDSILKKNFYNHKDMTRRIAIPIIDAMIMESNKNLYPKCRQFQKYNCQNESHFISKFANYFQSERINNIQIENTDSFKSMMTQYKPQILKIEKSEYQKVQSKTISENMQHYKDKYDVGNSPISSQEVKSIFNSEQNLKTKIEIEEINSNNKQKFDIENEKLMNIDNCRLLNQKILDWALKTVPSKTIERQNKRGIILEIGEDIKQNSWQKWNWAYLNIDNRNNQKSAIVQSPSFLDPEYPDYHQCKLLSPFKAIEWIQIDGLRSFDNFAS